MIIVIVFLQYRYTGDSFIMIPRYNDVILLVAWYIVISGFHCTKFHFLPAHWSVTRRSCSAKGFIFFGISHSPKTPLGHAHRWSICKHYVDKLQRFFLNCHNILILTMPTALGRRSEPVYGEKSPKTRLVCIYCYGNTLYIVNLITW